MVVSQGRWLLLKKVEFVRQQLPFLLQLADDTSPVVRKEVASALTQIPDLKSCYEKLEPTAGQRRAVQSLLAESGYTSRRLLEGWAAWLKTPDDEERLESALSLVASFQSEFLHQPALPELLDSLAETFRRRFGPADVRTLAEFLFGRDGLRGETENYYDPRNSNLVDVWISRTGIPISLCAFYMLVGRRLDLRIEACNYPEHFLARVRDEGQTWFVDCFHQGRFMDGRLVPELAGRVPLHAMSGVLNASVKATAVVARVLKNLVSAYQQAEEVADANLFTFLLKALERGGGLPNWPQFAPGVLVRHRSRKFRGVVVDYDLAFEPDGDRMARDPNLEQQPWYRILVDGSSVVSYSAESNLRPDSSSDEVRHPFINYFFQKFEDGLYYRNNLPWPK